MRMTLYPRRIVGVSYLGIVSDDDEIAVTVPVTIIDRLGGAHYGQHWWYPALYEDDEGTEWEPQELRAL